MSSAPKIAAIIPVYNRPRGIIEALESVAVQTLPPHRLVVVDDGSADDTAQVVEQWFTRHAQTCPGRLIRQANQGASAARNRGAAEAADCDLLAFLDSDDLWPADYLQRMVQAFTTDPKIVAATCDRLNHDEQGQPEPLLQLQACDGSITTHLIRHGPPGTPNTVIRAAQFRAVGGYDPAQPCGEDYQLMLRLSLRGAWKHVPGNPVIVRRDVSDGAVRQAGSLSKQYNDRRWRLARMMDQFIFQGGGKQAVAGWVWRRRLGRLWYSAGRQLLELNRRREAADSFRRAVRVMPWHLRAMWQAWRMGRRIR